MHSIPLVVFGKTLKKFNVLNKLYKINSIKIINCNIIIYIEESTNMACTNSLKIVI